MMVMPFLTTTLAVAVVGIVFVIRKMCKTRNAKTQKRRDAARAGHKKRMRKLKAEAKKRRSDAARLGHARRLLKLQAAQDAQKRRSDAARLGHLVRKRKATQQQQRTVAVNVGCCVHSGSQHDSSVAQFAVQVQA